MTGADSGRRSDEGASDRRRVLLQRTPQHLPPPSLALADTPPPLGGGVTVAVDLRRRTNGRAVFPAARNTRISGGGRDGLCFFSGELLSKVVQRS
ncbi:hypothetical protein Hanom_Chr00s000007g01615591 [Helianthus anomalus]